MTNKEAVKLIREIEEDGRNVTSEHIKALDLAIKALERDDERSQFIIKVNTKADVQRISKEIIRQVETGVVLPIEEFEIKRLERPQGEWIPIKTRELTAEEKEENPDIEFAWDCPIPEEGQDVIITTKWGNVQLCTFCWDAHYGSFFDEMDDDEVIAWMPLPNAYKQED